jgi:type IV secretion system protein VirD4
MADNWTFGSSKWADIEELHEKGFIENGGMTVGYLADDDDEIHPITYNGDSHLLTIAPTRSGKGTTQIIPALMDHVGGLLCIDPKGENAIITAAVREDMHGQNIAIFDPWGVATEVLKRDGAKFNPLDMLTAESPNLADDAMLIADALIVPDGGDSHWSNEAKAMLMGFIIHLVTSPDEDGQRNLGRLREILSLPPQTFQKLIVGMSETGVELAKSAANRIMQKSERELSSVISTAQQNTHFLESQQVKTALSESDFQFENLTDDENPISVFLCIPADRLNTHGRLLRLMVSMAITAMVRTKKKPKTSALFILDEFAALGKLAVIEQAFGLMAGFGMQIHAIIQDLSQLQDLYGQRWQTFLGNAGVVQFFGTRDVLTAEYASKICGQTTIETISEKTADIRKDGEGLFGSPNPEYRSMHDRSHGRPLAMPEEIMRMSSHMQIVFMPNCDPANCGKFPYYQNIKYFHFDKSPIYNPHPNTPKPNFENTRFLDDETRARWHKWETVENESQEPTQKVKKGWFGYKVE